MEGEEGEERRRRRKYTPLNVGGREGGERRDVVLRPCFWLLLLLCGCGGESIVCATVWERIKREKKKERPENVVQKNFVTSKFFRLLKKFPMSRFHSLIPVLFFGLVLFLFLVLVLVLVLVFGFGFVFEHRYVKGIFKKYKNSKRNKKKTGRVFTTCMRFVYKFN